LDILPNYPNGTLDAKPAKLLVWRTNFALYEKQTVLTRSSFVVCTMDEWSTREFGEWEGEIADRTKARRSEIVRWSER